MKVRLDFVTNSSTSSYICEVCGELYSERDACLSDAEMIECENSHVVCQSHLGEVPEDEGFPYGVPADFCPICSLKHVRDGEMFDYLLEITGAFSSKDAVRKEIQTLFPNLKEFKTWHDKASRW